MTTDRNSATTVQRLGAAQSLELRQLQHLDATQVFEDWYNKDMCFMCFNRTRDTKRMHVIVYANPAGLGP